MKIWHSSLDISAWCIYRVLQRQNMYSSRHGKSDQRLLGRCFLFHYLTFFFFPVWSSVFIFSQSVNYMPLHTVLFWATNVVEYGMFFETVIITKITHTYLRLAIPCKQSELQCNFKFYSICHFFTQPYGQNFLISHYLFSVVVDN